MICLDTNVVVAYFKGTPPRLIRRLEREILRGEVALPVVSLFELQYGIEKSTRRRENAARLDLFLRTDVAVLLFESDDAAEAADIRAALERAGTPIGPYDLLIAAQARRRGALLVTANSREFDRVPDLRSQDWSLPG